MTDTLLTELLRASSDATAADDGDSSCSHEGALDEALEAIDARLRAEQFSEVNEAISKIDFDALNLDVAVLVFMATKLVRDRLPARKEAKERFGETLRRRETARAQKILAHL